MSYLDGKTLNTIKTLPTRYYNGRFISIIELWITGGTITLDEDTSEKVRGFMREAKRMKEGVCMCEYVRYRLIEEGVL